MKSLFFFAILLSCLISSYAQDFSGSYILNAATGQISLDLKEDGNGIYTGTLSGNNNVYKISGQVQNGILTGRVGEEGSTVIFVAQVKDLFLAFTMAERDYYGNINTANAQVMTFVKSNESSDKSLQTKGEVIINNNILSKEQIRDIVARYGIEPKPGNYWYDRISGLYGVSGYASYGFMHPGHNFGLLSRDASAGNTGVIINGRELPQNEWAVWSYILGYYIKPGSYWLDSQGNAGYEGSDIPVVNLFVAARKNTYSGQGSGGDNFWSGRFSAGNSNADNTQGYVSVPGYGPVGYGF